MKTFGTLSTFIEPISDDIFVGRQVAAAGFLKALFQHSGFERFDFFLPNVYSRQFAADYLRTSFGSENLDGRVRLLGHAQLPEFLRKDCCDVFHLADFTTYLPALAHLRQNLAAKPFPITGLSASVSEKGFFESYFHMMLRGVRDFDGVICISRCVKEALEKSFRLLEQRFDCLAGGGLRNPISLEVIPLAVEAELFGAGSREESRHKLDLPQGRSIILIFGRYSYADKMDLLPVVDLALRLEKSLSRDPPLFVVAGSDPVGYRHLLKGYAERRGAGDLIRFCSGVKPEQKPQYYSAADVFLSPSDNLQESFGITILEAMASRLPVVASDFNGYRELVKDGETGFCIPTYWGSCVTDIESLTGILYRNTHNFYFAQSIAPDLDRMAQALETLLIQPGLRNEMGLAGRRRVESLYTWKEVIRLHREFWNHLSDKAHDSRPGPAPDPFQVPYYQLFNHYPTRPLAATDTLTIADGGRKVLDEGMSPPVYPELAEMISGECLRHILVLCSHESRQVNLLLERLQTARRLSPEAALFHLLWGLKHGLWRLAARPPASRQCT